MKHPSTIISLLIFFTAVILLLFSSCSSEMRIDKRKYRSGFYVSVNEHKNGNGKMADVIHKTIQPKAHAGIQAELEKKKGGGKVRQHFSKVIENTKTVFSEGKSDTKILCNKQMHVLSLDGNVSENLKRQAFVANPISIKAKSDIDLFDWETEGEVYNVIQAMLLYGMASGLIWFALGPIALLWFLLAPLAIALMTCLIGTVIAQFTE